MTNAALRVVLAEGVAPEVRALQLEVETLRARNVEQDQVIETLRAHIIEGKAVLRYVVDDVMASALNEIEDAAVALRNRQLDTAHHHLVEAERVLLQEEDP